MSVNDRKKETAKLTEHADLNGDKLYQMRARKALPILVRQAKAEQPIIYSDLATELDMPNPRNLDFPLGTIGNALLELSKRWKVKIPPIQCLVVNKYTGIPGPGFDEFVEDTETFKKQKKIAINRMHNDVFQFDRWDQVLVEFDLKPIKAKWSKILSPPSYTRYGSGGESEEHKRFKDYIAKNPVKIGLPGKVGMGKTEYVFRSADAVDVMFIYGLLWIGVEVKARNSSIEDIERGIYQCVKYKALIEAEQIVEQQKPNAEVILVLEGEFPKDLIPLKNTLGTKVVDKVAIP